MKREKIAVLMGGLSSEREISLKSGAGVMKALAQAGRQAAAIDLTADTEAFVRALKRAKPDVVFNALHGKYGEDGCVPALLNMMQIPYTHSGVMASAIAMNKDMTRRIAAAAGVDIARGGLMTRADIAAGKGPALPCVVKPNAEGSSIGVSLLRTKADEKRFLKAAPAGSVWLAEEYIPGREVSVAVRDDGALGTVELVPERGFYDFHNKYTAGAARHIIPAQPDESVLSRLMSQAFLMHCALGCRGISRADFRVDDSRSPARVVFLELNTHPGLTELSLFPEIARSRGISYADLVLKLIEEATCDA